MRDRGPFSRIAGGFTAFLATIWRLITDILAEISGWDDFNRAFPDRPETAIETLNWRSARIRGLHFRGCLKFEICKAGLRVSVPLPGHSGRPFFVSWREIHAERTRFGIFEYVKLTFGPERLHSMLVRERIYRRLAAIGHVRVA